jgi:hypothetical protein
VVKQEKKGSCMEQSPKHPWRVRTIVGLLMLILSFVGLIITDTTKDEAWYYWRAMTPIYALLSIILSWYLRGTAVYTFKTEIWQEILHWIGLLLAVYIVSTFVSIGLIGKFEAGLTVLVLLAIATFLAGIYHDIIFMIVGIILGIFSLAAAILNQYLYTLMLPVTLVAATVMVFIIYKNLHHSNVK